jgi:alkanesulfonate monooxygenase
MELGVHVSQFTFPGGPQQLAEDLTNIAVESEQLGFTKLSVMDHVFQIGVLGPPEEEMI